ncbi:MAG: ferrochelatase [Opitutaceae bacterium]|nr:ferrochelatase [Opitutaceae bacterium]
MGTKAVLLVNLGSPESTSIKDVKAYLKEFLSDDRVFDLPKPLQQLVLRCFILPFRPKKAAHAYEQIWQADGSPLLSISRNLRQILSEEIDAPIYLAMRYGKPSLHEILTQIAKDGHTDLLLIPLYPHYAMSSYETVTAKVFEILKQEQLSLSLSILPPFYADPGYISAHYQSAKPFLDKGFDHILFSYHGLPVRHMRKADSSKSHCTIAPNCCTTASPVHATCYKAQTGQTTKAFVELAQIPPEKYSISYQSRLAGEQWITPFTDHELIRFGKKGIRLLVITPAFVSDCLETLEEIAMAGRQSFLDSGGKSFQHIPCLNEHPEWIQFLKNKITNDSDQRD